MKRIRQKLNSQSGVSILIALVGFMFAAMISAVIVTAAVTAAQRVANDREENQAHLTLESAAQIVRDEIESTEYTFTAYTDTGKIDTTTADAAGAFAAEMEDAVETVDAGAAEYESAKHSADFTVSLNGYTTVKTVNGTFIMAGDDGLYDLVFTLTIDGSNEEIYITADGSRTTWPDDDGHYKITWKVVSINVLGGDDADAG